MRSRGQLAPATRLARRARPFAWALPRAPSPIKHQRVRAALASLVLLVAPVVGAGGSPRVIEDDWPRALAEAKARDLPIFVDAWAPW